MSTPAPVLALERVTVRYGRTTALESVSFEVPQGSVFALLGRNGAGKSSAVRCLLGQRRPEAGRALILGKDAWKNRAEALARTGVVPEEPDMPPAMTADALVRFSSRLYARWDGRAVLERLERFGVPRSVPAGRLSKGQRAQLALALALGHSPEVLVLDDPTLGLDALARRDFFGELIGELADRGLTVLLTSHDLAGVERIADRVAVLNRGRIVLDDSLETLKSSFSALPGDSFSLERIFAAVIEDHATGAVP